MDSLVRQKNLYEAKLISIFTKYSIKFIVNIYENTDNLKQFQKKLYKIPNWEFDKKDKEYKLFLKYILKKYDETEKNLTDTLENIYTFYIKIMSSVFISVDIKIPKLIDFWHKILKKVGKIFYENPTLIKEEFDHTIIKNIIKNTLQTYIPIKEIIHSKKEFEVEPLYYNFSENESDHSYHSESSENQKNLLNDLKDLTSDDESDSNKLKYISSEQFENDYHHSEDTSENINVDDIDIKYIKLKK
jgi:hypothetical protein